MPIKGGHVILCMLTRQETAIDMGQQTVQVQAVNGKSNTKSTATVSNQVDDVIGIMQSNVEKIVGRGEKIEALHSKTEDLHNGTFQFKKTSAKIENEM